MVSSFEKSLFCDLSNVEFLQLLLTNFENFFTFLLFFWKRLFTFDGCYLYIATAGLINLLGKVFDYYIIVL